MNHHTAPEAPMTDAQIYDLVAAHESPNGLWNGPTFTHDGILQFARALLAQAATAQPVAWHLTVSLDGERMREEFMTTKPDEFLLKRLAEVGYVWKVTPLYAAPPVAAVSPDVQELLRVLDEHMYTNDYCGLEVGKHYAPIVTEAIERVRAAIQSTNTPEAGNV
jgi:hypothetical protein